MSAKAMVIIAAVCLAGVLAGDTHSLARGGGGSHGGGMWGGHGGRIDGFSMHRSFMGFHDHGERGPGREHDMHSRHDDRRDRFEHRRDHRYAHWDDHSWHRGSGFGDMGHAGLHAEGTWSRGGGFGDDRRGLSAADGQWHPETR